MENKIYCILILDESYVEEFELFDNIKDAKKSFKRHLRECGLGILKQRKYLKEEFYKDGTWQIQLIKTEMNK